MRQLFIMLLMMAQVSFAQSDIKTVNENLEIMAKKIMGKHKLLNELSLSIDPATYMDTTKKKAIDASISLELDATKWTGNKVLALQADLGGEVNSTAKGDIGSGYAKLAVDVDVESLVKNVGVKVFGLLVGKGHIDVKKFESFAGCPSSNLCGAWKTMKAKGDLTSIDKFARGLIKKLESDPKISKSYASYLKTVKKAYSTKSKNGKVTEINVNAKKVNVPEFFDLTGSLSVSITASKITMDVEVEKVELNQTAMGLVDDLLNLVTLVEEAEKDDLDDYVEFLDQYIVEYLEIFS